jgi:hypothetical protein
MFHVKRQEVIKRGTVGLWMVSMFHVKHGLATQRGVADQINVSRET